MRKPDLGRSPLITQTFIVAEVELVDEGVDDPATVDFHQLQAKYQLHVLRGSPEDLREVLPILPANDLQQGVLRDGLLLGVLLQQELHQHAGLPCQRISERALSGRAALEAPALSFSGPWAPSSDPVQEGPASGELGAMAP